MIKFKRYFLFLLPLFAVICSAPIFAQTSHDKIQEYVNAGGLRNFEIDNSANNFDEVLQSLEDKKGSSIYSDFIFYTDQHSFKGSLIQTTNKYYVVAELDRVNAQKTLVKRIHVIERGDVIGITATFSN